MRPEKEPPKPMPFGSLATRAVTHKGHGPSWECYSPGDCLCRVSTGENKDSPPLYR